MKILVHNDFNDTCHEYEWSLQDHIKYLQFIQNEFPKIVEKCEVKLLPNSIALFTPIQWGGISWVGDFVEVSIAIDDPVHNFLYAWFSPKLDPVNKSYLSGNLSYLFKIHREYDDDKKRVTESNRLWLLPKDPRRQKFPSH